MAAASTAAAVGRRGRRNGLDHTDIERDILKGELLADMAEQMERAHVWRGDAIEANGQGALVEFRVGVGHLAIEREGEIGIQLFLQEVELRVRAIPRRIVPDYENHAARCLVEAERVDDVDALEAHGVVCAGMPCRASFCLAPAIFTTISLLSLSMAEARVQYSSAWVASLSAA